jgi:site-specific DNA recombinase
LRSFDETLRTSLDFLAIPWNLWASERLEHEKAVLKLAFADRLAYVRNDGFRTPNLALPFKVLADLKAPKTNWRARRDSNPRPLPPEGSALSS